MTYLCKLQVNGCDGFMICKKLHSIHPLMSQRTEAIAVQHSTNLIESYLLFKCHISNL